MNNAYKTILEYLKLNEAKADDEYTKSFSSIDRAVFDKICLMDPKTQRSGETVINIGFGAKQLLLPKYMSGETTFVDNPEAVSSALINYYPNIKNYPKFPEFESVAKFLEFMADPVEVVEVPKAEKEPEDKISAIYNKYYSDIPRDIFDSIIEIDPDTTADKIGDVAKNLLLRCYKKGDTKFLKNPEIITAAIYRFNDAKSSYDQDKQNLTSYATIDEFVNYMPPSPAITALTGTRYAPVEGTDFIHIASSKNYDVFKLLTFRGSERLAHARGAQNVWCTAGGSDGTHYGGSADHSQSTSYWRSYSARGPLYMFLHKTEPTNKTKNWNMSYDTAERNVYHFLNGDNSGPYSAGDKENGIHKNWNAFLLANPDVAIALSTCSESNLRDEMAVQTIVQTARYSQQPFQIKNVQDLNKFIENYAVFKALIKEIIFENVPEIPAGLANNFILLEKITIKEGIEKIGVQAFKNCPNLTTINQDLPETLKIIEEEAFMSCRNLKGSIHIPDSLEAVKLRAFDGTRCKLKIDKNRTKPIRFSSADRDWVNAHVMSIKK